MTSSSQRFLSHKSYFKTEYFLQRSYSASLLPVGLKRASLFLWERKVLQHMLTLNNHHSSLSDFAAQQGYKFNVFSLCLFSWKILLISTSLWKIGKENEIHKTRTDFATLLCYKVLKKTFHHHFWNSRSRCHFRFMFNLKATPQMLKLLAISCNVSFCQLSFFWAQAEFPQESSTFAWFLVMRRKKWTRPSISWNNIHIFSPT